MFDIERRTFEGEINYLKAGSHSERSTSVFHHVYSAALQIGKQVGLVPRTPV